MASKTGTQSKITDRQDQLRRNAEAIERRPVTSDWLTRWER